MPTYYYKCSSENCQNIQECVASMKEYNTYTPSCNKCGSLCGYTFIPSVPLVSFLDGPSGSWPSKGNRFKKHREKSAEAASKRQRDRYGEVSGAVPNYQGQETGTWAEAQFQAMKDKGAESAATFNNKVKSEKQK